MNNKLLLIVIFVCLLSVTAQAKEVLVFAAHPDDESIGAGGILIQEASKGSNVTVVIMTDGCPDEESHIANYAQIRKNETISALALAGIPEENIIFMDYDDLGFMFDYGTIGTKAIIETITSLIQDINPDEIYVHAYEHGHIDHDATHYMIVQAAGAIGFNRSDIYEYIEYNAQYFGQPIDPDYSIVDITQYSVTYLNMTSDELQLKQDMIAIYVSQEIQCSNQSETDVRAQVLEKYYFGADMIRELPDYDYTKSPCIDDTCRWDTYKGINTSSFYSITSNLSTKEKKIPFSLQSIFSVIINAF